MDDIDFLINSLFPNTVSNVNTGTTSSTSVEVNPSEEESSHYSQDDISDILADNGYPESSNQIDDEDTSIEDTEFNEEEVDIWGDDENYSYSENEEPLSEEELRNTPNEALPEDYTQHTLNTENAEHEDYHISVSYHDPTSVEMEQLASDGATASNTIEETAESSEEPASEENVEIPLNSPTLLMDEATTRFSGTEWYNEIQKSRVIIAGIGGIGSNVAFQLARMIPANMTLYDNDYVERVNMAGQLYSHDDVGTAKVDAIATMIRAYTSMQQVYAVKDLFTLNSEPGDIMICGFDNMRARRTFFTSWLNHINIKSNKERAKCLYIDGRLSIDTLQIFCITGDDNYNINRYDREFLFTDSEAEVTVCSMKQTTYLACMIGSLMVNLFTNFIANSLNPIIPYDLPFFTEYNAQSMLFKTEN